MHIPARRSFWHLALAACAVCALGAALTAGAQTGSQITASAAPVRIDSLRHGQPLTENTPSSPTRQERDSRPLDRDFVQQPPLIPHTIDGYQITKNYNKCMDCHSFQNAKQSGATRVSVTHFRTREGTELDNISPRRYFCTQCHVPLTDAKPLVENTFQRARGMR